MRNTSGHQGEKSEQRHFFHKTCNPGSFWQFHVVLVQNNDNEMYKKVCCMSKVAFLLIRPIVVFLLLSLSSPLFSKTRLYILFEQIINISESFAFSAGYQPLLNIANDDGSGSENVTFKKTFAVYSNFVAICLIMPNVGECPG